ncbi:ABC transporter permease subunit [Desulfovibrio sp. OttesenSCG-928-A18]|nr:ABC transporter permease subunit [Desulfovibrio sp. OttesenSCG-928-A18]
MPASATAAKESGQADKGPFAAFLAAGIALTGIVLLFAMVIAFALPAFRQQGPGAVLAWSWRPYQGDFGILPMLAGSMLLALSALALAWPLAVLLLCGMLPRGPAAAGRKGAGLRLRRLGADLLPWAIRLMTAVPTVVYGFAALFLLTPLVRRGLGGSGLCLLSAALVLALLILPGMVLVMEAGLAPRLQRLCPGGLALGFSRLELLWHVVFPSARKTLLASALLGFGRAMGDTLLPLMLAGNAPQVPGGLTEGLRTLTAHMALVTANEVGGAAYDSLFAAGALLLGVNTLASVAARRLARCSEPGAPPELRS